MAPMIRTMGIVARLPFHGYCAHLVATLVDLVKLVRLFGRHPKEPAIGHFQAFMAQDREEMASRFHAGNVDFERAFVVFFGESPVTDRRVTERLGVRDDEFDFHRGPINPDDFRKSSRL